MNPDSWSTVIMGMFLSVWLCLKSSYMVDNATYLAAVTVLMYVCVCVYLSFSVCLSVCPPSLLTGWRVHYCDFINSRCPVAEWHPAPPPFNRCTANKLLDLLLYTHYCYTQPYHTATYWLPALTPSQWLSCNALVSINEVTLRRSRLVLGWVT